VAQPSSPTTLAPVAAGQLQTDFVSFPNGTGLRVAACLDHGGARLRSLPWVVLAPKYGETKKNNLQLAYHLVANGLNVLRFDHTNHVGESEGDTTDFTLTGAGADVTACLDFLAENFDVTQVVAVANSLSARCVLRVAANDPRITKLVSIAGVVNLLGTMQEIYREDILGLHRAGHRWGVTNFLGLEIDGDAFLEDILRTGLHALAGTVGDAARLRVPMVYFYPEQDAWVARTEVEEVIAACAQGQLVGVPAAMHEVRENPRAAEDMFKQVVWACQQDVPYPGDAGAGLQLPDKKKLLGQNRRERERLRRSGVLPESETEFWSGYLKKYSILEKSTEYRDYLNLLGRLCGPPPPGALVLDAGCGNGLLGRWLLREVWQHLPSTASPPPVYVGLDLTRQGLNDALAGQLGVLRRAVPDTPGLQYALVDFDLLTEGRARLPFQSDTFEIICCSLVLSYLKRPQALLDELHRVLRPGGVLVVSSMKPHCDLSVIYRDSIGRHVTDHEVESGRNLLRAAGKIKLKEEIGHYTFYSPAQLATLVMNADFKVLKSHLSLGNQAAVIQANK